MNSNTPLDAQTSNPNLPPRIPGTVKTLERAICLLGHRSNGNDLGIKVQEELVELTGAYPTVKQAALWKQSLKKLTKGAKAFCKE